MRLLAIVLALVVGAGTAEAQSLEEAVLALQFGGRTAGVRQESPGVAVSSNGIEARVVDAANCVVRVTDRNRPAYVETRRGWDGPSVREENTSAKYDEWYLGRVIPSDVRKVEGYKSMSRDGVDTRPLADANWRLAGSPGDEVWCNFWPDATKHCVDHRDVERIAPWNSPTQDEDTQRVDRALTHIYADLCKGAPKRVPFR